MNASATRGYLDAMKRIGRTSRSVIRTICGDCGHRFLRGPKSAHRCPSCLSDDLRRAAR